MAKIPKYVQVLNKCDPDDKLKEKLIKMYKSGGFPIDSEMSKRNPNAKMKVIFISSLMKKSKKFNPRNNETGYWIYCGDFCYVRFLDNKYEFAQYYKYDTDKKQCVGLWDEKC